MWRFLLGGLATVAGVVGLFVASFGDVPAIWQHIDRQIPVAFRTPAPAPQPTSEPDHATAGEPRSAAPAPDTTATADPAALHQREAMESHLALLQRQVHEASQQLTALHDQAGDAQKQLAQVKQQRTAEQAKLAKLQDEQQQLAQLEQQHKEAGAKLVDLQAQQQQLANLEQQRKAEEAKLAQLRAEQEAVEQARVAAAKDAAEQVRVAAAKDAAAQAKKERTQRADAPAHATAEAATPQRMQAKNAEPRPVVEADASALGTVLQRLRNGRTAPQQPADAAPAPAERATPTPPPHAHPAWHERLVRARSAVAEGHMGEAQRLLEEAQLQLVFRPVTPDDPSPTSGNPAASDVAEALSLLGAGHQSAALRSIDRALGASGGPPEHAGLPPLQPGYASWNYPAPPPSGMYRW